MMSKDNLNYFMIIWVDVQGQNTKNDPYVGEVSLGAVVSINHT